ncbi:unnamed protein product [Orchesella dallaii]|uniref:Uncharacterized protein n=1 Tax=Orchesella dallaii TaxID=48710 RepID=A0ABP1PSS8_9HEXA
MAKSRKKVENSRLLSMSEEECALMGGYTYCPENIRSADVVEAQEIAIRKIVKLNNGYPAQCGCQFINQKKCTTSDCPNRQNYISCPPSCGTKCQNNPWAHNLFVANQKTFLKKTNIGLGVFASSKILAGSFIGEYTGKVTLDTTDLPEPEDSYFFKILPKGHIVQGYRQGSRMRCVNHSCEPNCDTCEYIHNGEFKIVFYAKSDISPNEELTIDYTWEWTNKKDAPPCKCGKPKCNKIIGTIRPKKSVSKRRRNKSSRKKKATSVRNVSPPAIEIALYEPPPFPSTVDVATAEVTAVLTCTPRPQERLDGYIEDHVFRIAEPAYIITQYNGRVGIVQGRITECYTNKYHFTIYVVNVSYPTSMQYHMPRYMIFHYPEDAAFVLQHLIPELEIQMIRDYTTPYAAREVADGLNYAIAPTYIDMAMNDTRPETILEQRKFPGPVALGLTTCRLVQTDSNEESGDEADEQYQNNEGDDLQFQPTRQHRSGAIAQQLESYIVKQISSHYKLPSGPSSTAVKQCRGIPASMLVSSGTPYDPLIRRSFPNTRENLHNLSLVRRNMESAIENVTWYAISRTPDEVHVDYHHVYGQVTAVDGFADFVASRTANNSQVFVLQPGLPKFTRKAENFEVQSSYKNILNEWPVHEHIEHAPDDVNYQSNDEEDPRPPCRPPRPAPSKSKTTTRHRRQAQLTDADEDTREHMHGCIQVEDYANSRPGPSSRPHRLEKPRSKKRAKQHPQIQNPDSDPQDGQQMVDGIQVECFEEPDPCSTSRSQGRAPQRSNTRSRRARQLRNRASDEDGCPQP